MPENDYEVNGVVGDGGVPAVPAPSPTPDPDPTSAPDPTPESTPVTDDGDVEVDEHNQPVLDEFGQPKRKMGGFQRRIEKLRLKLNEKDEEIARLRASQSVGQAAAQALPLSAPTSQAAEPKRDDFDSHEEYTRALVQFEREKLRKEILDDIHKESSVKTEKEVADRFKEQLKNAPTKFTDWHEVLEESTSTYSAAMDSVIRKSNAAAELIYHLAKDEAEAARIASLPTPEDQIKAMGVLEFKLTNKPTQSKPTVSNAPPPIQPVTNVRSTNVSKDPSKMEGDEYLEYMRAQKAAKR